MECPYCGGWLEREDQWGRLAAHQDGKVLGEIFRCQTAIEQEGKCESETFSVCGSFYTDEYGDLHDGYPC